MIGQTLAHYHVTAALGAGGMGEVYRATDTKLGRDVAIKVLPAEVAKDPERLARFEREAHLLASLNHPHIAAIHGLEEADGQPFLVLELVEGADLRQRLAQGAIPLDEALEIARQVAEALEEAHGKGIIHRDLKPANVKVTPDGKVKVLDFGLAKAWAGDGADGSSPSASMSQSPTLAHSGTAAGVILGTAAYMSPEQARGKAVDKRSDVWAFGVLLWEMLTGQTLFAGDTVTDVIAGVVTKEPDLDALPADTPRLVRRLIVRCLRKDPRTRLPDIGGARLDLQDVLVGTAEAGLSGDSDEGGAGVAVSRRLSRQRWIWAGAWLLTAAVAAYFALAPRSESSEAPPAVRFVVEAPEGWSFCPGCWPVPSPDGRHVLMATERAGPEGEDFSTWLRSIDSPTPRRLTAMGTPDDLPFWSPDGRFIGFAAEGELRKFSVADGVVQTICTLPTQDVGPADWSADGTIIFAGFEPEGLYSVPAAGGEAKLVFEPDAERDEGFLNFPQFLPDGRRLLFVAGGPNLGPFNVYVASLDTPEDKRLLAAGPGHHRLAGDRLIFNRDGTLFAQPFDPGRAEVSGEPVPIASSVAAVGARAVGAYGISAEGTLAYLSGLSDPRRQLAWVDRKGARIEAVAEPRRYVQVVLSPDERRVAAEIRDPETREIDLWVIDLSRGVARRLTSDPGNEQDPVWSPDSQELVYGSNRDSHMLFRKGLSGGPAVPVPNARGTDDASRDRPEGWLADGKALLIKKLNGKTVWTLPLEGGGEIEPVLELESRLDEPQVSPDGRWLAYTSEESGDRWEVYVQPFRGSGERVRVSLEGGGQPQWRGDGKELFYLAADGRVMAVDVREGTAGPEVSLPTALFELERLSPVLDNYSVSADGQRFLVRQPPEHDLQMHVVLNWETLLETEQ